MKRKIKIDKRNKYQIGLLTEILRADFGIQYAKQELSKEQREMFEHADDTEIRSAVFYRNRLAITFLELALDIELDTEASDNYSISNIIAPIVTEFGYTQKLKDSGIQLFNENGDVDTTYDIWLLVLSSAMINVIALEGEATKGTYENDGKEYIIEIDLTGAVYKDSRTGDKANAFK